MRLELKRVEPMRAANIGALVYGIVMAVFALVFLPFLLLGFALAPSGGNPGLATLPLIMLFMYPLMGLVMGWLSGLCTSWAYNVVIRFTGGLLVDFHETTARAPDQLA
jgi:hypothetical protein